MATGASATCWSGRSRLGDYRLEFDIGREDGAFFTKVAVDLHIDDTGRSYHVPLLLAPYSMTTYRGS